MDKLLTIGYENENIQDFIYTLNYYKVDVLLDIRELPLSRKKGFSKKALATALQAVGITYHHEKNLGSPKLLRNKLRQDGNYKTFFRTFQIYLSGNRLLLKHLAEQFSGTIALMCFEKDYRLCHRFLVAEFIKEITGIEPQHIGVMKMLRGDYTKRKIFILVKAYPQPSKKYEETVCVAGITEEGQLLRLYSIPYRQLKVQQRFDRFDYVEMEVSKEMNDHRPESHKVLPKSIKILKKGKSFNKDAKARLWQPFVSTSLNKLKEKNRETECSLGIIKPEPGSVQFQYTPIQQASSEEQEAERQIFRQSSLFESESMRTLEPPEYVFRYDFISDSSKHSMKIHDWEVQTTYWKYKAKYGEQALDKMIEFYEKSAPQHNLHFVMGTMMKHPRTFIIIGVLRTTANLKQKTLF
ncbi:MAG: DUF488 domain-containing protein [Thioploca sp.]|nr:DUF488 domain-containing protein [Thioploca sp.]